MFIRYIGSRTPFHDPLYKTGIVWNETGDEKEVADDDLARFMVSHHPDIFEAVYGAPPGQESVAVNTAVLDNTPSIHTVVVREPDGSTRLLRDATLPVVRAWSDERLGMQLPPSGTRKDILDLVEAALMGDPTAGVEETPEPEPAHAGGLGSISTFDADQARAQQKELDELLGE